MPNQSSQSIAITLAFAPDRVTQLHERLSVPMGCTAAQALALSDWQTRYPWVARCQIGVFGRKIDWQTPLQDGDRLEFYRPLTIDPMRKRQLKLARKASKN